MLEGLYFVVEGSLAVNDNKRPMGHMAHPRNKFKSINTFDYHNVEEEKKGTTNCFMRIQWIFI